MSGRRWHIFWILLLTLSLNAQVQEILPRGIAPAAADVAYIRKWQAWGNPAALAHDSLYVLSAGYENRYLSPELHDAYLNMAVPTHYFNVGAAFNFFGFADYHEMMAALTVSKRWGRVALGAEFDYFNMYIAQDAFYRHAFTAQVGLQIFITDQCVLGFRLFNPLFSKVTGNNVARKLPVMADLGCGYTFIRDIDLLAEIGYVLNQGFRWNIGLEYRILQQVMARCGVRGYVQDGVSHFIPSLGAGIRFAGFGFDLAADFDYRIGVSLCSNLSFSF